MPGRRYRRVAALWMAGLALAGCSGGASRPQAAPSTTATPRPTTTSTSAPTTVAPTTSTTGRLSSPTTAAGPAFAHTVSTVTAADLPHSWRSGCPVGPAALRALHLSYWGFDGHAHLGTIIVNASVVTSVVSVFRTLFQAHFAIYEMVPVDAYGGDDNRAAAADDTSGFNCRNAVAPGPPQWSAHAFGEAIDVNDVQNPYVYGSTIIPPAGSAYLNRSDVRPGMAEPGGVLVRAFAAVGWQWGGRWSPGTDYQHFSSTGG